MATKTQIKQFLKQNNLNELDMDKYWEELKETNWKIKNLSKAGKTWRDMNITVIGQIPTQKQRDLERIERDKKEDEEKKAQELKKQQEEEYYEDHFEEVMINKIENNEELTENELSRLVYDYEIEREKGEDRRWSRTITSYVQLEDRFFVIDWEQGLTEMQENMFYDQPYEVEKQTYEKVIPEHKVTVTDWVRKL